jgi:hypothetical protein
MITIRFVLARSRTRSPDRLYGGSYRGEASGSQYGFLQALAVIRGLFWAWMAWMSLGALTLFCPVSSVLWR